MLKVISAHAPGSQERGENVRMVGGRADHSSCSAVSQRSPRARVWLRFPCVLRLSEPDRA
jgi:hypothetical protein